MNRYGGGCLKSLLFKHPRTFGMANQNSDIDLLLDSGLRGLQFVGLIEDVRSALDKEVDVFDESHIIPNSKIFSEISKDGVVIYEK